MCIFLKYIVNKFRVTLSSKQVVTVYDYCIRYKITNMHLFNCNHPYNIINIAIHDLSNQFYFLGIMQ